MNFEQAFLAVNGFIGYSFYMMIREQRDKKEKPAKKKKKQEAPKPTPVLGTSIVSQVSDIRHSNVEVINIISCPFISEPASVKREQKLAPGIAPADDSQFWPTTCTETRGDTLNRN